MTDLRFHGFPTGARVDLSVTHADTTLSTVIAAWPDTGGTASAIQHNNDGNDGGGSGGGGGNGGTGLAWTSEPNLHHVTADTSGASFTIAADWRHPDAHGPEIVWCEVDTVSNLDLPLRGPVWDPIAQQCEFVWEVVEGLPDYQFLDRAPFPIYRKQGEVNGRRVGLCLPAGTWTIRCRMFLAKYDGTTHGFDEIGTAQEMTVTVRSWEEAYPEERRIYVDPDGDFTGVPGGALTATDYRTTRGMSATGYGNASGGGYAILLRAGKTHDATQGWNAQAPNSERRYFFGAFGTGARPVLNVTEDGRKIFSGGNDNREMIVFDGLHMQGPWDEVQESGNLSQGIDVTQQSNVIVHDCTFDGLATSVQYQGAVPEGVDSRRYIYAIVNCKVTNWQDYGFTCFGAQGRTILWAGNSAVRDPNAAVFNLGGKQARNNRHGSGRISQADYVYIDRNDFHNRNSWGTTPAYQPALRLGTAGPVNGYAVVNRCLLEGNAAVAQGPANGNPAVPHMYAPLNPGNVIFTHNIGVGSAGCKSFMEMNAGGTTWRGNYFVQPDVRTYGTEFGAWAKATNASTDGTPENFEAPIRMIGNTLVNLMSADDVKNPMDRAEVRRRIDENSQFPIEVFEEHGNLYHAPSLVRFAPVDGDVLDILGHVTPRNTIGPMLEVPYQSENYEEQYAATPGDMRTPVQGCPIYRPAAGSAAIGAADGVMPCLGLVTGQPRMGGDLGAILASEGTPA